MNYEYTGKSDITYNYYIIRSFCNPSFDYIIPHTVAPVQNSKTDGPHPNNVRSS